MSSDLMRRYIDILNETQQPQQLDEGMMDTVKAAATKILDMAKGQNVLQPYIKQALTHKNEIFNTVVTSKSPQEVLTKIQTIAKGSAQPLNELSVIGPALKAIGMSIMSFLSLIFIKIANLKPELIPSALTNSDYSPEMIAKFAEQMVVEPGSIEMIQRSMHGVGQVTFLVIMLAVGYIALAIALYQEAKANYKYNKDMYPDKNPVTGKQLKNLPAKGS